MRICNILFKGKIMIKNETLKKILPSSILLNPIGKNGNEIWIEDFEQLYPIFFKSVLEIQKTDISEFSGFGDFTEDGKPEYSTFQAFLIKSFDDSNDDYWKNWKELFHTSMMKKEFFEKYFNKMIELGSFCQNQRNKRNFPRLRHAKQPSNFKRQPSKTDCLYEKVDGKTLIL